MYYPRKASPMVERAQSKCADNRLETFSNSGRIPRINLSLDPKGELHEGRSFVCRILNHLFSLRFCCRLSTTGACYSTDCS
jgi:hypothetical protein